jgi:amidase
MTAWLPSVQGTVASIARGDTTPVEVVEAAIRRIEDLNPRLNAVVWTRFDAALDEAARVDRTLPLAGLPILLKDAALRGAPFSNANKVYAEMDWRFPHTDVFVERMLAAGAIVLGYTNIPEFTSAATTESELFGPCRNPWDTSRSSGGSSGGAGAAVAAGMVPAAQSSDGGGSSRIPASANGVFTIKTSRGRTPLAPSSTAWVDVSNSKSFETRSVVDFALLLDVVAGADRRETLSAPASARPFLEEAAAAPGRLRVGYTDTNGDGRACHPESRLALERAVALLVELGHEVEEAAPATFASGETLALILGYWPSKVAARSFAAEAYLGRPLTADDLEPATFGLLAQARQQTVADFAGTLEHIRDFSMRSLRWWEEFDILLTPATGSPPPPLGTMTGIDDEARAISSLWGRFAPFANLTGQPAASVPLHWTSDGLPVGVQLVADSYREDVLVRLCRQLEEASPWADRHPPVSAL